MRFDVSRYRRDGTVGQFGLPASVVPAGVGAWMAFRFLRRDLPASLAIEQVPWVIVVGAPGVVRSSLRPGVRSVLVRESGAATAPDLRYVDDAADWCSDPVAWQERASAVPALPPGGRAVVAWSAPESAPTRDEREPGEPARPRWVDDWCPRAPRWSVAGLGLLPYAVRDDAGKRMDLPQIPWSPVRVSGRLRQRSVRAVDATALADRLEWQPMAVRARPPRDQGFRVPTMPDWVELPTQVGARLVASMALSDRSRPGAGVPS